MFSRALRSRIRPNLPLLGFILGLGAYSAYLQLVFHDALARLFLVRIFFEVALAALAIAAIKNVLGVRTLGTFAPAIVALAFLATGLPLGLANLGIILGTVMLTRRLLVPVKVQASHRIAILVTIVSVTISSITLLGLEIQQHQFFFAVLFPVLISAWMAERYVEQVTRVGWEGPTITLAWTLGVIIVSFIVITQDWLVDFVMLNPLSWFGLVLLNLFLGTKMRLRLSERFRFGGVRHYNLGDGPEPGDFGDDVLTMVVRNREFVAKYNPPSLIALLGKHEVKALLLPQGIPMARTHLVIRQRADMPAFTAWLAGHDQFALKPASGYGGEGILLVKDRLDGGYDTNKGRMDSKAVETHALGIIEGEFNGGEQDAAVVEELLVQHELLKGVAPVGLPDIRLICFLGYPVMAMMRIPTKASGGKANLHMGAIGAGIRISTGSINHAVLHGFAQPYHPDTGQVLVGREMPFWDEVLEVASEAQWATGLGFAGVDVALDAKQGPVVMEVNRRPGLEIQNANAAGLLRRLRMIEELPRGERPVEERVRVVKKLDEDNWRIIRQGQKGANPPTNGSGRHLGSAKSDPDPFQILPPDFYKGKAQALKATALVLILLLAFLGGLTATGRLDPATLLGPHVQRSEWAYVMTGARELAAMGLTGAGINVCIVDSGLDVLHPDFAHSRILAWRDFVNFRPDPYDDRGHGTAMAGLIAAKGSIRGIAPEVGLIIVKVVNSAGDGSPQNVAAGIHFCVDPWGDGRHGADIISISLGSKAHLFVENSVYNATAWATAQGVFVVAAAGNDGLFDDGDVEIPANAPLAIAVGAVDSDGTKAPFTSIGSSMNRTTPNLKPELVAPGVRLISTAPGAHFVTISGTSPATAVVAGILALLLEAKPSLRPGGSPGNIIRLKNAMEAGARKALGQELPHDPWYGYGIVNGPATLATL